MGYSVANARVYVLDRGDEPVTARVAGELCVGGVQVAHGRAARTAEKIDPDPFSAQAENGCTAPASWLADGSLEFLGRNAEQVRAGGFRIEPGEVRRA